MAGPTLVDVNQALDLKYNRHLSYAQIAAIQGVTPQAIHQRIKDLLPMPENQVFVDHRADILSNTQLRLLANLDDAKMQQMTGKDLVVSAAVLYDKERLERGMSTANLASLTSDIASIKAKRRNNE